MAKFVSVATTRIAQEKEQILEYYDSHNDHMARHAGSVCEEQAGYIQDLMGALEDAQSWADEAENAAQNAHSAIQTALKDSGLW